VNPEASYLLWTDRRGRELALLVTGAAVALGLVAVGIAPSPYLAGGGIGHTLTLLGLAWLAFGAGALLVGRLPVRWAVPLIGLGGLVLRRCWTDPGSARPRSSAPACWSPRRDTPGTPWSYGVAGLVVLGSWVWLRHRRERGTGVNPEDSRAGPRTCGPASDDALVG
jgi:hypothetical protein